MGQKRKHPADGGPLLTDFDLACLYASSPAVVERISKWLQGPGSGAGRRSSATLKAARAARWRQELTTFVTEYNIALEPCEEPASSPHQSRQTMAFMGAVTQVGDI